MEAAKKGSRRRRLALSRRRVLLAAVALLLLALALAPTAEAAAAEAEAEAEAAGARKAPDSAAADPRGGGGGEKAAAAPPDCEADAAAASAESATCRADPALEADSSSSSSTSPGREDGGGATPPPPPAPLECGLWLAPSSLPDAGMGMYAGRNYRKGEALQDSGDAAIPIVDLRLHWGDPDAAFLWDEYTWEAPDWDPDFQLGREGYASVEYASPGFGSAANSFLPLQNVEEENPVWVEAGGLRRSQDPGAGAASPYGDRVSVATRDIEAGEELFVSYGESWFTGREFLGPIPLFEDLDRATALARAFAGLYRNSSGQPRGGDKKYKAVLKEVWSTFVEKDSVYRGSRVLGAFNHSDPSELERLLDDERDASMTEIRTRQSRRGLDWLAERGACADHIRAGPSTLPQAGRGAFARRNLPPGTVVASLPLIHVPDRSIFDMYPVEIRGTEAVVVGRESGPVSSQLLLNYCYGHAESTLLLCPYGPHGSYLNHNRTLKNARLAWSDPARSNHRPEHLGLPIEALLEGSKSAKLSMDAVATREIMEGEEVFLDYGDGWEEAWRSHVERWTPPDGGDEYRYAVELNRDPRSVLPTASEELGGAGEEDGGSRRLRRHPNAEIGCSGLFVDGDEWRAFYPDRLDEYLANETAFGEANTFRCDITARRLDEGTGGGSGGQDRYLYSATVWTWDAENDPLGRNLEEHGAAVDVPREAFAYFQRPYASDAALPGAFRRPIGIPDDLMPHKWKNLRARAYSAE